MIAAIAVVLYHSTMYVGLDMHLPFSHWRRGSGGVDIFFVLSGFVIVLSTQKLLTVKDGWKVFVQRRLTRIVPLYWIAVLLKVALVKAPSLSSHVSEITTLTVFQSLFFLPFAVNGRYATPILNVGWTLELEMFFYLLFTLAMVFRRNVYWFIGIVLLVLSALEPVQLTNWPRFNFYTQSLVMEFFFGMLAAKAVLAGKLVKPTVGAAMAVAGLILLFFIVPMPLHDLYHGWIFGGPAFMIVYGTACAEPMLDFIPAWCLFLGDASYAIYLFHSFCAQISPITLAKFHLPYPYVAVGGSLLLGIAAGSIAFQWIDLPIMKWFRNHVKFHGKKTIHVQETSPSKS